MKELRIYTLKNKEAMEKYANIHWERHLKSLPKFGYKVDNVYKSQDENKYQVIAIVSHNSKEDLIKENEKYMNSQEFKDDMQGFQMEDIINVETVIMAEIYS